VAGGFLSELHSYVDVMIADRCRRTTDILLAKLIELEVDGEELTVDDIRGFVAAFRGFCFPASRRKVTRHAG
jgi:hypothetical protein